MFSKPKSAQPALEFIPPSLNLWVLRAACWLLPWWIKSQTNISKIEVEGLSSLVDLYQQFQDGKVRFLLAFRHPNVNDPYCLVYLLWKLLPQQAKKQGLFLKTPTNAHFIYDRGIPLWAGPATGWLYSKLGGTSIQRGKTDLMGLRSARALFLEGEYPMAAAPEGATNGHNEIVSPLEPGIAQLSFWCVEDLRKAQRIEKVYILPVGFQYFYLSPPWQQINQLLAQLESDSGLPIVEQLEIIDQDNLYPRLTNLAEHLLAIMENFYRDFYHKPIVKIDTQQENIIGARLNNLLNTALEVAEEYFNLPAQGNLVDRCRRLEQAGWEYIFREELKSNHSLSVVEKGLADRLAQEAQLKMWHMRIVESFVSVTGYYVKQKPTAERFAETILLLWDLVTRIKGDSPFSRPHLAKQRVQLTIGQPICVTERYAQYQQDRKQAVNQLTQDLQSCLEALIV
jgi:hypothetical protein